MKWLSQRTVQVVFVLSLYLFFARWIPLEVHQGLYSISLLIKDLLLWLLPITVGFFIAHAIASFEKRAPLFIFTLFLFEALSNLSSVWYAFGCGHIAATYLPAIEHHPFNDAFSPLWRLPFLRPIWWSADKGTFLGLVLGILSSFGFPALRPFLIRGKETVEKLLTRFFAKLIPLFLLGFIARIYKTNLIDQLASHYAQLIVWLCFFLIAYLAFLFLLGSGFSRLAFTKSVKNLLPAATVSLSSSCSLSTMPWTIEGAGKNMHNPELAKAIIPATTNIQQIGDCIANAFLCFLLYRFFYGQNPDLATWASFSVVFMLARFATAAVTGGAIFIMLPIYEAYLHFTPEMIALILAFNVVLDPLITCANVVANGALCPVFEKVWRRLSPEPIPEKQ